MRSNLNPPPGGKWVSHWGGIIQSYEPESTPEAEEFKAAIDTGVFAFKKHKDNLLAVLLKAWERGPKSQPFDKEEAWHRLTRVAWLYFWRKRVNQETRPAKDRSKRLSKIATILTKARRMFDDAKQDTLIDELYSAWCDLNISDDAVPDGPLEIVRLPDEFDKVLAAFLALEAAALRALEEEAPSTKPGPAPVLRRNSSSCWPMYTLNSRDAFQERARDHSIALSCSFELRRTCHIRQKTKAETNESTRA